MLLHINKVYKLNFSSLAKVFSNSKIAKKNVFYFQ